MLTTKILIYVCGALIVTMIGMGLYTKYLRSENKILESNIIKLELVSEEQKAVILQKSEDIKSIRASLSRIDAQKRIVDKELENTEKKFNKILSDGNIRDIGSLSVAKPDTMERLFNRGTEKAKRCYEISMGSPLTDKELSATKPSQINSECPHIANPNYVP
jgi:hypothetical protein